MVSNETQTQFLLFFLRLRNTGVVLKAGFGERDRFRERQNAQLRPPILKEVSSS